MDKPKAKTRNFIVNALIFLAAVAIIFIPAVKVFLISLMMQIGLMRPPTESQTDSGFKPISTEINLKNQNGQIISSAQLKGKILIVNFWATWCPPCRAEMPSLNEMYRHYKDNPKVMLLCVDADGDMVKSVSFMKQHNYDMPVYIQASELPLELSFETIPTTFIIDDKLRIVARHEGAARYDEPSFYNFIDGLVNKVK